MIRALLLSAATVVASTYSGQSASAAEPTKPPASRLDIQGEWTHLAENKGDRYAVKFTYWRNLGARRRFNVEVPLVYVDFNGAPAETGVGDTWFKYYWLDFEKPTEEKVYQGFVPIFELLLPTGDEDKGLGGGAALVRPTLILKFRPSVQWSIDPLLRYVISLDDYFVGGNPDSPIPSPDEDATDRDGFFPELGLFADLVKVRGFNIEVPFVRTLADNRHLSFVAIKAEIFQSRSKDNDGTTVTLKLELGKRLNDRSGISGEVQLPVQGDTTFDAVLKVTGNIFF
ncbi:MAG: hypothetical protein R3268_04450 [Acidiferrobacterales bacterium]|nr:hypothetical protein [Acidiferrobacterales bacterium]